MTLTWRRPLGRLCLLVLGAVAGATATAAFARAGWLPELAVHFRPQYLLAALVLVPLFLCLRRRRLALAALVVALPNAWHVAPYLLPARLPASVAADGNAGVTLVVLNLHYRNGSHAQVREYLQRARPDVLVLTELTPEWVRALSDLTALYPYWLAVDRRSPWGLGVYSRFPLDGARAIDLGMRGSVNVVARLAVPGGEVQLVAVHLSSPTSAARAGMRNAQLGELATLLAELGGDRSGSRRLLVGDLNVTPYSPYLRDLLTRTGMTDARRLTGGLFGTWPTWMPLLQVQIDHCIADAGIVVTRVERGPAVGSDHYPLEVTLR
jgi:endonuclease/exonuclease/phosphatase (EEP) superfamily protein YafD